MRVLLVEDEHPLAEYIATGLRKHAFSELIARVHALVRRSTPARSNKVWDECDEPFTDAIRITVGTRRRKPGDPPVIETVTRACSGYRIGA